MLWMITACLVTAEPFWDHGVGAPVAELRTLHALELADGQPLIVAAPLDLGSTGYILVTDPATGETEQFYYPDGVGNGPVFVSFHSSRDRYYVVAGKVLVEFDLAAREWTWHGVTSEGASDVTGVAIAEATDGRIFIGTYPNCHLVSFDPTTQEMVDHGAMDPEEKYFNFLALGDDGWVYCGIGTARQNIVAFNLQTGEKRNLVPDEDRVTGTAPVIRSVDGNIYGTTTTANYYRWLLQGGEALPKPDDAVVQRARTGVSGYGARITSDFPSGGKVTSYDLESRTIQLTDAAGAERTLAFDYRSEGAAIQSVVAGPDNKVYASSAHPMHFIAYDPAADTLEDWGPLAKVGGGNFCSMAVQGDTVVAASYSGGHFWAYDTTRPWNNETGDAPNPRVLAQWSKDIARPRATAAHPDGRHVIMAGFMGYGLRGGGLGIVDLESGEATLLTHEQVVPEQSTISLAMLPNGDLYGGTSIHTPGGGHPTATEAELYRLDWATKKVTFRTVPCPGATDIVALRRGSDGLIYGLTNRAELFVLDPETNQLVHQAALAEHGGALRHGLQLAPEGPVIAIMSRAILAIQPETFEVSVLGVPPKGASMGGALLDGRAYWATGSHLWSFDYR